MSKLVVTSWQELNPDSFRKIIFVKYPLSMTGDEVMRLLDWAKWHDVVSLHDCFIVKCGVKPPYLKHFKKDNKAHIVKHVPPTTPEGMYLVEDSLYE